ncbi:electron transfer flavoprotein alpha subunit apoprotein [Pacificibacter maritimus]|uniref:Electron transfer flavoprotein subunit alpha n=1 Tax=Pacificibacter maritimus TaxID=762213 RepID=A0A3N4URC6_9RHOB|nr:FAD-binding protein [Pacificibacter maritimus]RPE63244.1 electron transfer flavoprotein alpha subunit apoprotein [Pacificibacter maritimus]
MTVLCLAEVSGGALALDATSKAVTASAKLGDVTLLVCGPKAAAEDAAKIAGVSTVLLADDPAYANGLAENIAALIVSLKDGVTHITAASTSIAKNVLPRVAALLDVMILSDVIEVVDADTFKRPVYAGNAVQTVKTSDAIKVVTFRTSTFDLAADTGAAAIEAVTGTGDAALSSHVSDDVSESDRPELTSAGVVVSGGRGVGSEEDFALIEKLADKLGGAVGASRAAVDSGYAANDLQVGQTGKVVAPDLYVAIGISGAIQHLAGMKDSKVIVAINKDEEAPIFQVSDFGLAADLFQAVPELLEKL